MKKSVLVLIKKLHTLIKLLIFLLLIKIVFFTSGLGQPENHCVSQVTAGKLLFKSGFEGNVAIVPYGRNKYTLTGTDKETNFAWNRDLPAKKAHFVYLTGQESPDAYIDNRIEETIGADGKPTNALYMEVTGDYPEDDFITRNEFSLFPSSSLKQGYIKYSMKLQKNYLDAWPDKDAWRVIMEWKEPKVDDTGGTNNYRFYIAVKADREQIHWAAQGDQFQPKFVNDWTFENKTVSVPIDQWFDLEVFWHQGDEKNGRLWFAVNGQEVIDYRGRTQHKNRPQELYFWSIFKLYSGSGKNVLENTRLYQWIDNVEIWSDFPDTRDARFH